ncbi:unnamed protein product [Acanthoscelides obtectus]|uniref:Uncharacterized protein n=1 Tax=Acanthoscelides obtectus TaxID=200917 RepID=A0A9P0PN83_ACAOB|nr:unnamed protein product [Acanthoscelides obtectus]CAK1634058.1 hypothetical protein AOBTE_LOCUS8570 [Acanthoscelides obtectus]
MFISSVMLSLLPPNICRTSKLRLVYPGCIGHHKNVDKSNSFEYVEGYTVLALTAHTGRDEVKVSGWSASIQAIYLD